LLKYDLLSVTCVAPTVSAVTADAGEYRHASALLFPAATTTTTPLTSADATASLSATDFCPPRLMLMTHLFPDVFLVRLVQ
jgi:hypothetical protein